jgi:hypothetical protein
MSDPIPLSALKTPGVSTVSPIGSDGVGGAKLLTAAELRAAAEAYSAAQVDAALALRVPYTGANAAVNLGSNGLTCGAVVAATFGPTAGGTITTFKTTNYFLFERLGAQVGQWNDSGLWIRTATGRLEFGPTGQTALLGGVANTLEQRNGLNPQTYNLFSAYISGTSFQSLCLKATASAMQIGSARGTSDANLPVQLGHFNSAGAFTSALSVAANGSITASGDLNFTALPTSDPGVAGRVWRDGTTLKISV